MSAWKPLTDEQRQAAHELAIDQSLHIDDKDKRRAEVTRKAVATGAAAALDLVSVWLKEQSPELHEKFIAAFGQNE